MVVKITVLIRLEGEEKVSLQLPLGNFSCSLHYISNFSKGMFLFVLGPFNSNTTSVLIDASPSFLFKKALKVSDLVGENYLLS